MVKCPYCKKEMVYDKDRHTYLCNDESHKDKAVLILNGREEIEKRKNE